MTANAPEFEPQAYQGYENVGFDTNFGIKKQANFYFYC